MFVCGVGSDSRGCILCIVGGLLPFGEELFVFDLVGYEIGWLINRKKSLVRSAGNRLTVDFKNGKTVSLRQ